MAFRLLPLALLGCEDVRKTPHTHTPPNVVWIVVDTLRADHLGTYGYERKTSPAIDALARRGAVFESAVAHAPWTKPSVATMLTGLEPRDHGITDWDVPIDPSLDTVQGAFHAAGYATHAVVSHHAFDPRFNNFHVGFDTFDVSALAGATSPHEIASSEVVSSAAVGAIRDLPEPFFLFLHYFDPHEFYLRHDEFPFGDNAMDRYDAEIAYTDLAIGQIIASVDSLGLSGRTYIVLTADHGEEFGDHGGRVHTLTLYQEALAVPWIVAGPGIAPDRVAATVGLVHQGPTILNLAGVPAPIAMRGRPVPRVNGRFVPFPEPVFSETRRYVDRRSVVDGRYKLIVDRGNGETLLFDLREDPKEKTNLASNLPEETRRLSRLIEAHEAGRVVRAPIPLPDELAESLNALGYADPTQ